MYYHLANMEVVHTDFRCVLPLQTLLGALLCKATNPSVHPSNFKGPIIKEALVVFRVVEKQGRAQGLPIRTPSPALAQLPVHSLANGSEGIPKGPYRTCQGQALFCPQIGFPLP